MQLQQIFPEQVREILICSRYLKPKKGVKFKQVRSSPGKCRICEQCVGNTEQAEISITFHSQENSTLGTCAKPQGDGDTTGQGVTPHQGM